MLLRLLHRLWAHQWEEIAYRLPMDPEHGLMVAITQLVRRCRCGAIQSAQVMGDPVDGAALFGAPQKTDELNALRKMAGLE